MPAVCSYMTCYIRYAEYSENSTLKAGRDLRDHCFKDEEGSNLPHLQLYYKHAPGSLWFTQFDSKRKPRSKILQVTLHVFLQWSELGNIFSEKQYS